MEQLNAFILALANEALKNSNLIDAHYDMATSVSESQDHFDIAMCVEGVYKFLKGLAKFEDKEEGNSIYSVHVSTGESICVIVPKDGTTIYAEW